MRHFVYDEGQGSTAIRDLYLWKRVFNYSKKHALPLCCAILASLIITGTTLCLPALIQKAVDGAITATHLSTPLRLHRLTSTGTLFLICIITTFVATFIQVIVLEWTAQTIMHRLRQDLFAHLLRQNLPFFDSTPSGRLVTRLTNDIQNMHEMFTSVIITALNDILRIIGVFVMLFCMNIHLALLMTLFIPIAALISFYFARIARRVFRKIRAQLAQLNGFLSETVSGISTVQVFGKELLHIQTYAEMTGLFLRQTLEQIKIFAIFMPLTELMSATAIALILWYGGSEILKERLTLGELIAFLSYMRLFFQPLRDLAQKFSIVQSAMASAERIFELFDTKTELAETAHPQTLTQIRGDIDFEHIHFSYDRETEVFAGLDLHLKGGETLAVVGTTGSGKTSLISLLLRFYEPQQGKIRIDGVDIREIRVTELRNMVGIVLQDILVLDDTLFNNIALETGVSRQEVEDILHETGMRRFVTNLPTGLDTRLGEGGRQLSTGEKQLLSFIRVLCRRPAILILDEATAAIDTESENILEAALSKVFRHRTSLIIAHRLSTIRRADRIIVMDKGTIIEEGRHQELIDQGGQYASLIALDGEHHPPPR